MVDLILSIYEIPVINILVKIVAILVPLLLTVAYFTYAERKIIGYMQVRIGPNRVGPRGWLQPIADAMKLMFKEIIFPAGANRVLFTIAPTIAIATALAAWAVVPFGAEMVLADLNVALLFVLAMTSVGVYGVILAGWSSNSKYAVMSTLRTAAQVVSYEIAMGFALVGVVMAARSLNIGEIVEGQSGSMWGWYMWPLLPLFVIYFVSGVAETNRAPFDVAEGESEIVAGFHLDKGAVRSETLSIVGIDTTPTQDRSVLPDAAGVEDCGAHLAERARRWIALSIVGIDTTPTLDVAFVRQPTCVTSTCAHLDERACGRVTLAVIHVCAAPALDCSICFQPARVGVSSADLQPCFS